MSATAAEARGQALTFVARYGHVRYTDYLGDRYPREGECELGVCRIRRAEDILRATRQLERIPGKLAALEAELAAGCSHYNPVPGESCWFCVNNARRRVRLLRSLGFYREILAGPPATRAAMLVFDHCHAHGWVRGIVCMACNNALSDVDHGRRSDDGSAEAAAMLAHLGQCPDCASGAHPYRISANTHLRIYTCSEQG